MKFVWVLFFLGHPSTEFEDSGTKNYKPHCVKAKQATDHF